jgi:hypothetical protein
MALRKSKYERVRQVPAFRAECAKRFLAQFSDPLFKAMPQELGHASAAWQTGQQGRKSPNTRQAGPEFADTTYDLSWIGYTLARQFSRSSATIEARHRALFCSSIALHEHTRAGQNPKSLRSVELACQEITAASMTIKCWI